MATNAVGFPALAAFATAAEQTLAAYPEQLARVSATVTMLVAWRPAKEEQP